MSRNKSKGNKKRFEDSFNQNIETEFFFKTRIRLLCKSMFEWKGLPEGVDSQFVENNLYHYGRLMFYKHPQYGYIITNVNDGGDFNIYNRPLSYNSWCIKFNRAVAAKSCVIIRNNIEELPTSYFANYYIEKIYQLERSIDSNIALQKFPALIGCSEEQRLFIENLMMKYEGNQPFIFTNKNGVDLENFKCLDLKVPFVADKLEDMKARKWNDCLNTLGINNANTDKKERLITDEVNSNNQFLKLSLDVFLSTREDACKQINLMFPDLNVSVEIREDFNLDGLDDNKEGDLNG